VNFGLEVAEEAGAGGIRSLGAPESETLRPEGGLGKGSSTCAMPPLVESCSTKPVKNNDANTLHLSVCSHFSEHFHT